MNSKLKHKILRYLKHSLFIIRLINKDFKINLYFKNDLLQVLDK
jgi:hypothetical protein